MGMCSNEIMIHTVKGGWIIYVDDDRHVYTHIDAVADDIVRFLINQTLAEIDQEED